MIVIRIVHTRKKRQLPKNAVKFFLTLLNNLASMCIDSLTFLACSYSTKLHLSFVFMYAFEWLVDNSTHRETNNILTILNNPSSSLLNKNHKLQSILELMLKVFRGLTDDTCPLEVWNYSQSSRFCFWNKLKLLLERRRDPFKLPMGNILGRWCTGTTWSFVRSGGLVRGSLIACFHKRSFLSN